MAAHLLHFTITGLLMHLASGSIGCVGQPRELRGLIYPPLANIRKISAQIADKGAAKAYELGLATRLPQPDNLVAYAESFMYGPSNGKFR